VLIIWLTEFWQKINRASENMIIKEDKTKNQEKTALD
jgi:hypothetical protein